MKVAAGIKRDCLLFWSIVPRIAWMGRTTTAPAQPVLLYDGQCVFCRRSTDRLRWLLRDDAIEYLSFRDDGALDRFPGVTEEACDQAMQLVTADGRVFAGAEAAARAMVRRPWFAFAWLYYVPPVRWIADAIYKQVAIHRFGISGRSSSCSDDVCALPKP